jgi:hypothetical protein
MNLSAPLLGLVGTVAGVVTAVGGYQLVTADLPEAGASESGTSAVVAQPADLEGGRVSCERCKPPAELRGGVCVTHKWRTVVVDSPSATSVSVPSAGAPSSPNEVASQPAIGDDDSFADQSGDHEEFGDDDDHGDDHDEADESSGHDGDDYEDD